MLSAIFQSRPVHERALSYSTFALSGDYDPFSLGSENFEQALKYAPVWNAIGLISGDIGKLPCVVYRRTGQKSQEVDEKHPANIVNREPIPGRMGNVKWWRRFITNVLLYSNGYARIRRNGLGQPVKLQILESPFVQAYADEDGEVRYAYLRGDQSIEGMGYNDVLHVEDMAVHQTSAINTSIKPLSLIRQAQASFTLGLAIEKFGAKFFERGGRAGGTLEIPSNFTKKARDRLEEGFRKVYEDIDAAFNTVILRENAKFHQQTVDPDSTQMVESRATQVKDVARWFNLPPHKLGDDSRIAYNSLEQENRSYLDSCLSPRMRSIEDECDLKLFSVSEKRDRKYFVRFDVSELLQTDRATMYTLGVQGVKNGLISVNEWRYMVDMNPVEGGDELQTKPEPQEPPPQEPMESEEEPAAPDDTARSIGVASITLRHALALGFEWLERLCKRKSKHYGDNVQHFARWMSESLEDDARDGWFKITRAALDAWDKATDSESGELVFRASLEEIRSKVRQNANLDADRRSEDLIRRLKDDFAIPQLAAC